MSCEKAIFKQIRERGLRLTPQREMVLSIMHKMEGFASAERIYEGVQTLSSSMDISTVYRTLELLQEIRVVAAIDPGDGQRLFRLSDLESPRVYLVCRACGKVIESDVEQIRPLTAYLNEHSGFKADLDRLSIPGLCHDCSAERDKAVL
jgi:Fur family ferric uptake transcriptional regulator